MLKRFFITFPFVAHCILIFAQNNMDEFQRLQTRPQIYQVLKTNQNIVVDGKADEKIWSEIDWSTSFVDIEGEQKPKPTYDTRFKMVYDDGGLYIFAKLEESHIWGDIAEHDEIIYHNNDFEVFLKPDVHEDHYFEIEINVLNTILDLMMTKPYRFGGKAQIHWDTKGIKTAVHHAGTVNQPNDEDRFWSVEMLIPFAALSSFGTPSTPVRNSYWAFDFSRVQWQHEIENGGYRRKSRENKLIGEENWVWSPIGLINMHYPERWGYIQFVDAISEAKVPEYFEIKQLGWNIHYLQKIYDAQNKAYSTVLEKLPDYQKWIQPKLKRFTLSYSTNQDRSAYFLTVREVGSGRSFTIDHLGHHTYHE